MTTLALENHHRVRARRHRTPTAVHPEQLDAAAGSLTVTALRPGDVDTVAQVFRGLSPKSSRMRFHAATPRLTASALRLLAAVEPGRHEVLVASLLGRPVGLARWVRDRNDRTSAEVALEVVDTEHRHGIGAELARRIVLAARRAGVRTLTAEIHAENRVVRDWALSWGFRAPLRHTDPYVLSLDPR